MASEQWLEQFQIGLEKEENKMKKYSIISSFESSNSLKLQLILKEKKLIQIESDYKKLTENLLDMEERFKEFNHPKVAELISQIENLKLDQQDLYKTNALNAQRIVQLMDMGKVDNEKINELRKERDDLLKSIGIFKQKIDDFSGLVKEKDRVIEILKDELAAHQLELVQREEQLKKEKEKAKILEVENKTLVDRWMMEKEKDANKMNEANEIIQHAKMAKVGSAVSMTNKVLSLFNTGRLGTSEDFEISPIKTFTTEFKASFLPSKIMKQFKSAHEEDVNCIAISPDGSKIVTGGNDKKVVIYNSINGQPLSYLQSALKSIMYVAFNTPGDLVLATSNDNSIKIYQTESRSLKHTLTGHLQNIYSARFLGPSTLVSGSLDRTLKLWDLNRGYCTKNIFTLSSCYDVCPMNSDGSLIASGHFDNNVRIWDPKTGNMIREINNIHFQQITSVQMSPDERQLLTTSKDNTLKLIDTRMFLATTTMSAPSFRVATNWAKSCFSSDGQFVASGSADGCIYIWKDGVLSSTLSKHGSSVVGVVWNPMGGSEVFSVADKEKSIIQWGDE